VPRSRLAKGLAFVLVLCGAAWTAAPLWLEGLGAFLIHADPPAKADLIVVLAGDGYGRRLLYGAELARQGYAPRVLVSGPRTFYGHSEDQLAIPFAVRQGYSESMFIPMPVKARSTLEEAEEIVSELRRRGTRTVLVVTSNYHTRRARRLWREAAGGIDVRVVASPDAYFQADRWWKDREGRKIFFYEWVKLVTSPFGI